MGDIAETKMLERADLGGSGRDRITISLAVADSFQRHDTGTTWLVADHDVRVADLFGRIGECPRVGVRGTTGGEANNNSDRFQPENPRRRPEAQRPLLTWSPARYRPEFQSSLISSFFFSSIQAA